MIRQKIFAKTCLPWQDLHPFYVLSEGYVRWLCNHHPELLDEALGDCDYYVEHLKGNLRARAHVHLSEKESAELVIGRASLTQRAYKAMRSSLEKKNIHISR